MSETVIRRHLKLSESILLGQLQQTTTKTKKLKLNEIKKLNLNEIKKLKLNEIRTMLKIKHNKN